MYVFRLSLPQFFISDVFAFPTLSPHYTTCGITPRPAAGYGPESRNGGGIGAGFARAKAVTKQLDWSGDMLPTHDASQDDTLRLYRLPSR